MKRRLQIIRVDNDLVEKADLQIGNNIISRTVTTEPHNERVIKNAVTIHLSTTGEMTITPVAPCYMKSSGSTRWELLKLGTTIPIKLGDVCTLLADKCWFKIMSESDTMGENVSPKRKVETELDSEPPGKRVCVDSMQETTSSLKEGSGAVEGDRNILEDSLPEGASSTDPDLKEQSENQVNSSPSGGASEVQSNGVARADALPNNENACSANEADKACSQNSSKDAKTEDNERTPDIVQSVDQPSNSRSQEEVDTCNAQSTASNPPPRNKCAYGRRCYRRNSYHKQYYSHPGDPDYDIPDNRPECQYGVRCYRKNEQHRRDFKHTALRPRRSRALTQPTMPDVLFPDESAEESVDESDYELASDIGSSDDDWDDFEADWEDDNDGKMHKK